MKRLLLLIGILISTTSIASAAISFEPLTSGINEKPSFIKTKVQKNQAPSQKISKNAFMAKKENPKINKKPKTGESVDTECNNQKFRVQVVAPTPKTLNETQKKGIKIKTTCLYFKSVYPLNVIPVSQKDPRAQMIGAVVSIPKRSGWKDTFSVKSFKKLIGTKKDDKNSDKDSYIKKKNNCHLKDEVMTFFINPDGKTIRLFCGKKENGSDKPSTIGDIGSQATSTNIGAGAESSSDDEVDAADGDIPNTKSRADILKEAGYGQTADQAAGGPQGQPTNNEYSDEQGGDGREGFNDDGRYRGEESYGEETALEKYKRQQEEKEREGVQEISSTDGESGNEDDWGDDESVYPEDDGQIEEIEPNQGEQGSEGKATQESQFSEGNELVQRDVYNPNYAEYGDYPLEDNPVSQILEIDPSTQLFDNNIDFIGFEEQLLAGFSSQELEKFDGWDSFLVINGDFPVQYYSAPKQDRERFDFYRSIYFPDRNKWETNFLPESNTAKAPTEAKCSSWNVFKGCWWSWTNFWSSDTPAQPFLNNNPL